MEMQGLRAMVNVLTGSVLLNYVVISNVLYSPAKFQGLTR